MAGVNFRVGRSRNEARTGLDWNGDPAGRRAIVFTSPLAAYPATYIWKVYQRNQIATRPNNHRYYTTFFHGPNGVFTGGLNYYGAHPYPVTAPSGDGKWEISANSTDYITRDDASEPYVTNDVWYSQALVVSSGGGDLNHKFYIDLPSTATSKTITANFAGTYSAPGSPCVIWGQTPDNGGGASWGGYDDWEEQNAIIRGVQIYSSALSEAQIIALAAKDYNAEVLSYCAANSITSLWYLNMNWTNADISDKSGAGHNPSLVQTNSATPSDWSA